MDSGEDHGGQSTKSMLEERPTLDFYYDDMICTASLLILIQLLLVASSQEDT